METNTKPAPAKSNTNASTEPNVLTPEVVEKASVKIHNGVKIHGMQMATRSQMSMMNLTESFDKVFMK